MKKRYIRIKNFRNIGIDKDVYLTLNNDLTQEAMGGVVTIIGPNNSGKSNILDALRIAFGGNIENADRPDFIFEDIPKPEISLIYKEEKNYYSVNKKLGENVRYQYPDSPVVFTEEEHDIVYNSFASICSFLASHGLTPLFKNEIDRIQKILDNPENSTNAAASEVIAFYKRVYQDANKRGLLRYLINTNVDKQLKINPNEDASTMFANSLKDKFNFEMPHYYKYEENKLNNSMLETQINRFQNNSFFVSLFKSIDLSSEVINNTYQAYNNSHNISVLTRLRKKYQSKVDEVANYFNTLFHQKDQEYSFELTFNPDRISFGISLGDKALNYDAQSTGFQYFFNMFFNYFYNKTIVPGDVLIMDEPGTHLTVEGQEQLMTFLRQFAKDNHLTIVIVTHSPFLISPDYFEEIRIVNRTADNTEIINDFSIAAEEYHDTLAPVVRALTTRNSVVIDPAKTKVFVEGMMDYIYLTAFKIALGYEDLVLLPYNGVGKKGDEEKIIMQLGKIDKNPTVLADGDKAGAAFEQRSKGTKVQVQLLSKFFEKEGYKEIEDLFSDEERKEYNLNEKNLNNAITLKSLIINTSGEEVCEQTRDNFKRVLEGLMNL